LSKYGVKQVDRLLSNQGIEVDAFFEHWVPYVIGARTAAVIALDWTSFAGGGHEALVLSMLTRHGRATPLLWRTVEADTLKGKQTDYEDALLCRLYDVLPAGVRATIVADRGFADCKLLKLLSEELGFDYVVRLCSQYYVTNAKGERRKAANWVGAGGRARTLRDATLTDLHELPVATVVCVQAKDMCVQAKDMQRAVVSGRERPRSEGEGADGLLSQALGHRDELSRHQGLALWSCSTCTGGCRSGNAGFRYSTCRCVSTSGGRVRSSGRFAAFTHASIRLAVLRSTVNSLCRSP
jgi:hypothetical protein